jgi:hypothetical protein
MGKMMGRAKPSVNMAMAMQIISMMMPKRMLAQFIVLFSPLIFYKNTKLGRGLRL